MGQIDRSGSSPAGVVNIHLDSKGYYFANGVNIIPGQNIPLENITKEQAQDILKSEIINYINPEGLIALEKIANQETPNIPMATRNGQVLTSTVVDNQLVAVWDDLINLPSKSYEFIPYVFTSEPDLFTSLTNATYVGTKKHDPTTQLTPKDTSKPYGGDLYLYETTFLFKFNLQNDSVIFKTSTGVDITFKNNFDNTFTVTEGSQELRTLLYKEDGTLSLDNGYEFADININYRSPNGWAQITSQRLDPVKGRKLTSMVVNGSAPTIFYSELPF